MKVLKKTIWDTSYFGQIGILEGKNKTSGAEMLIEVDFKMPIDRPAMQSSIRELIESFPELQTLWVCQKNHFGFKKIPKKQLEIEIKRIESYLAKNHNYKDIFFPLSHESFQSDSVLPFRCITVADNCLIVSALHTHFHGVSMYAYIDILLHMYFSKLGHLDSSKIESRIKMYSQKVPRVLSLVHGLRFPLKILQTYLFLKRFQKKALFRNTSITPPSWVHSKHQDDSRFARMHWTFGKTKKVKLLSY